MKRGKDSILLFFTLIILSIPHIFIYGSDKKLRKEFKGETKAEAILKYLN